METPNISSLLESLLSLSESQRAKVLESLTDEECASILYDWVVWARPNQLPPEGDWRIWLILAGRGWGKTRTGAEYVRWMVEHNKAARVAIIAPIASDARDVMVEGESGLLSVSPPWNRPKYEPSKRRVTWKSGAIATTYSADEPDRLRGPQHDLVWADEIASWRYPEAWDMAMFGLRLGRDPRAIVTTTPKPVKVLRDLIDQETTVVTRGTTYENRANLAEMFFQQIIRRYEGTRLGRQELNAELLEDIPGALWTRENIETYRRDIDHEALVRIVVGVDPAVTSGEESNETGIIVAGVGEDGHGYVLADKTLRATPDEWARQAVRAYRDYDADRIVAEVNQGGDLVESVIRTVDLSVSYKSVHAARGKRTRAEPIAALYEQGRVHHSQGLENLEDQMCLAAGTEILTRRGSVPIEEVTTTDRVLTRSGWQSVAWAGCTGDAVTCGVRTASGGELWGTKSHPVWVEDVGFVPLREVQIAYILNVWHNQLSDHMLSLGESDTSSTTTAITRQAELVAALCCIVKYGRRSMDQYRQSMTSITKTATGATTPLRILTHYHVPFTSRSTGARVRGLSRQKLSRPGEGRSGQRENQGHTLALGVLPSSSLGATTSSIVADPVETLLPKSAAAEPVYNLHIENSHEYFANGILVHNCMFTPETKESPDRVDALVWALTELQIEETMEETSVAVPDWTPYADGF